MLLHEIQLHQGRHPRNDVPRSEADLGARISEEVDGMDFGRRVSKPKQPYNYCATPPCTIVRA